VVEGAAIRPEMDSFRRHESGMSAASNIRNDMNVPRGTIKKHLMFPGPTADKASADYGAAPAHFNPILALLSLHCAFEPDNIVASPPTGKGEE
jgi:hypothetical protein